MLSYCSTCVSPESSVGVPIYGEDALSVHTEYKPPKSTFIPFDVALALFFPGSCGLTIK